MGEKAAHPRHETDRTPLLRAVEENDTVAVISLLNAGADPNTRDQFGDTLLQLAVWRGNLTAVNALLRAGADPTQTDDDFGSTLLHGAKEERIITALLRPY